MKYRYKIRVIKGRNQWFWRLMALNGKTLAHSETYSSRAKAIKTAKNLAFNLLGCRMEVT